MSDKNDDDFDKREWDYFCRKYEKYCTSTPKPSNGKISGTTLQWAINTDMGRYRGIYSADGREESFYSEESVALND